MSRTASGLLTIILAAAATLATAGAATATPAESETAAVPDCVSVYLGNNVVYKYAKVTNGCNRPVRVKTIISAGRDGPCFYLTPGETRIDRYGVQAKFEGLIDCIG